VPITAALSTVYRQLSLSSDPTLAAKCGLVLAVTQRTMVSQLDPDDFPLFPLSASTVRRITIRSPNHPDHVFPFDPFVRISDLKAFIARKLDLPQGFKLLNASQSEDRDQLPLKDAGAEFTWIPASEPAAESEIVEVVKTAREVVSSAPQRTYRLRWDDRVTEIALGDDQNVGDAKRVYADALCADGLDVKAEHVSLLFRGKVMRDNHVLSRQRIAKDQEIVVYVRNVEDIILRSGRYTIGPPPPDFEAQVRRLEKESGRDTLTCTRCLRFHAYDFDNALADLREYG
jgi:hypothetical protein